MKEDIENNGFGISVKNYNRKLVILRLAFIFLILLFISAIGGLVFLVLLFILAIICQGPPNIIIVSVICFICLLLLEIFLPKFLKDINNKMSHYRGLQRNQGIEIE